MTIGIGRKFGRRILLYTDTMISDGDAGKFNAIPGRLKAIILSPHVSVAYAGHADPALSAVRRAKAALAREQDPMAVTEVLSQACRSSVADFEFILAFHRNGEPSLHKITARGVSGDLDACYIGDPAIVGMVQGFMAKQTAQMQGHPDLGIEVAEVRFTHAFKALFTDRGVSITDGVGGLPITLLASPYGHTYFNEALSMSWDRVSLDRGITPEQHQAQRAGETAWGYNLISGRLRGVGIVGAAVPQAGLGYVYAPLVDDEPEKIRLDVLPGPGFINSTPLLQIVMARVDALSEADGGGVEELPATWEDAIS